MVSAYWSACRLSTDRVLAARPGVFAGLFAVLCVASGLDWGVAGGRRPVPAGALPANVLYHASASWERRRREAKMLKPLPARQRYMISRPTWRGSATNLAQRGRGTRERWLQTHRLAFRAAEEHLQAAHPARAAPLAARLEPAGRAPRPDRQIQVESSTHGPAFRLSLRPALAARGLELLERPEAFACPAGAAAPADFCFDLGQLTLGRQYTADVGRR